MNYKYFQSKLDSNFDVAPLLKSIYMLIIIMLLLFVLCDFADNVSDRFDRTNIYEYCEWYKFPNELQRLLPIIINNTHKGVIIEGFGNIDCTREKFKKVISFTTFFYSS